MEKINTDFEKFSKELKIYLIPLMPMTSLGLR